MSSTFEHGSPPEQIFFPPTDEDLECASSLLKLSSNSAVTKPVSVMAADLFDHFAAGKVPTGLVKSMFDKSPIHPDVSDCGEAYWYYLGPVVESSSLHEAVAGCPSGKFCSFLLFVSHFLGVTTDTKLPARDVWRALTSDLTSPTALGWRLSCSLLPSGVTSAEPLVSLRVFATLLAESEPTDPEPVGGWMQEWLSCMGSMCLTSSVDGGPPLPQPFVPLSKLMKFHSRIDPGSVACSLLRFAADRVRRTGKSVLKGWHSSQVATDQVSGFTHFVRSDQPFTFVHLVPNQSNPKKN